MVRRQQAWLLHRGLSWAGNQVFAEAKPIVAPTGTAENLSELLMAFVLRTRTLVERPASALGAMDERTTGCRAGHIVQEKRLGASRTEPTPSRGQAVHR